MAARKLRVAAIVLLALTVPCASAFAAPPSDPPGKSGDAPGHQKDEGSPAEPTTPPGHAESEAAEPQAAPAVDTAPPAESQAPVESPRFTNAAGKPKHNVPAAAEAAPEASVSAPGNSGRHKITICHKGHAITVDVHAATAHVEGHGDNYAVAGVKGRAACPHSSGAPAPQSETPSGPGAVRPDPSVVVAEAGRGTKDPGVGRGSCQPRPRAGTASRRPRTSRAAESWPRPPSPAARCRSLERRSTCSCSSASASSAAVCFCAARRLAGHRVGLRLDEPRRSLRAWAA